MPQPPKTLNQFESLVQVITDLRGPNGCPWDKEQTHETLTTYAIEEVHELVEAIESKDDAHTCEELGDVLFQVVLHAELARQRGAFNIADIIESITSKIVRRHPHVFSDKKVSSSEEVLKNWDEIKKKEKVGKPQKKSTFDVPISLPALQRAHKIGEKTKKIQFDWAQVSDVVEQVKKEIVELEEVLIEKNTSDSQLKKQHEVGDILFSAAQLARHLEIEPESALREANRRFTNRFEKMLELGKVDITEFQKLSSEQKEKLWSLAKASMK